MVETNQIPNGFKNTSVGIIPTDWEVKKLSNIADIQTGSTPPTINRANYGDEYFFVSPSDIGSRKIIKNTEKKLSATGFNISRKFPKFSILFTCIGSTIGKCAVADRELTSNQQINAIIPNKTYNSDYLYYILNLFSNIIKKSAGETAVPIINKTDFGEFLIPLPPTITEQKAIATALNDTDELISKLEKHIFKKRAIKQGAMQELLKPKEEWRIKTLD
ncbi:MAG: restriction endonuclease subunit S, partial [Ignavibacteria bacterium]